MQTLHTCLAGLVRQRGLALVNLLCGSMHHDKTWDKEELPVLAETCCFKCFDVLPLERAKKRLNVCLFFSKMPPPLLAHVGKHERGCCNKTNHVAIVDCCEHSIRSTRVQLLLLWTSSCSLSRPNFRITQINNMVAVLPTNFTS